MAGFAWLDLSHFQHIPEKKNLCVFLGESNMGLAATQDVSTKDGHLTAPSEPEDWQKGNDHCFKSGKCSWEFKNGLTCNWKHFFAALSGKLSSQQYHQL